MSRSEKTRKRVLNCTKCENRSVISNVPSKIHIFDDFHIESASKIATTKTLIDFDDLLKVSRNMLSFYLQTPKIMKFTQKNFYSD